MVRMTKRSEKIALTLPRAVLKDLDAEVHRIRKAMSGHKVSRAEVVREILLSHLSGTGVENSYQELLKKSSAMRAQGNAAVEEGSHRRARRLYLQGAIAEITALSILDDPKDGSEASILDYEKKTKTGIIEALGLLRDATGYAHLPDIPSRRIDVKAVRRPGSQKVQSE